LTGGACPKYIPLRNYDYIFYLWTEVYFEMISRQLAGLNQSKIGLSSVQHSTANFTLLAKMWFIVFRLLQDKGERW
jgi:hypothetical protein